MKFFKILLLAGIVMASASCNAERQLSKVRVNHVEDVAVRGLGLQRMGVDLSVDIDNLSRVNIRVNDAQAKIFHKGNLVLTLTMQESVLIPRRTSDVAKVPIIVEFDNPLGMLTAPMMFRNMNDLTADISVKARLGMITRNFNQKGIPLSQILGNDREMLEDLFENYR